MLQIYESNLDLNLLRIFLVVAEQGSVTQAASRLYLTQPAVSAALRRLTDSVQEPLFARKGRGLTLTHRGRVLREIAKVHVPALISAALSPQPFDPHDSEHTLRLGLSDAMEVWLLPVLLRSLAERAPKMRFIVVPTEFRTVGALLADGEVDIAVTVADELPNTIRRQTLSLGTFCCLYDPKHLRIAKRISERAYFDCDHVIVSYNRDLRGVVEDLFGKTRRIRCSVSTFNAIGAIVDGSKLLATIPKTVANNILALRPHLATALPPKSFPSEGVPIEMLWPASDDTDPASAFVRGEIARLMQALGGGR